MKQVMYQIENLNTSKIINQTFRLTMKEKSNDELIIRGKEG